MKQCHDGARCPMQDKRTCEHACAARMQAPVAATLTACTALIGALGRHRAEAKPADLAAMVKALAQAVPQEYMLIDPQGRVFIGPNPMALAAQAMPSD